VLPEQTMTDKLEPISPAEAKEMYLDARKREVSESTLSGYHYRLKHFIRWCQEVEGLDNMNDLTGRKLQQFKTWRRDDGDLKPITLEGNLDALRVFIRWCESIDAVEPGLHEKFEALMPSLDKNEERRYEAVEALATVPIQLMFPEFTDCPMVILTGSASSGKTTVLELFKGWDRLVVTHEVTPAAFVSHNADQNDENLGELDLLPKIANQVLWVPEMGTWFTGDNVEEYMRTLAGVADGSGYVKSTGAQGTHGYDGEPGEYQFGMMGATTPPSPTAWAEMGNAGARLLFHRMPNTEDDDEVLDQVYGNGDVSYPEKKRIVREKIRDWLRTLWHEHDGEIEMETEEKDSDVAFATLKLAEIIALSRGVSYATMNDSGQLEGETQVEDRKRALQMLRYTARARAAMDGRKKVTTDDLQLCARIAFATIPERRRGIIRHMCNPYNGSKFTTAEVKNALDLGSKNTAKKRMQMIDNLGIATYESEGESTRGGQTDVIRLTSDQEELMWLFSAENDESDTGPLRWPFDG